MKVLVISDTHGKEQYLEQILDKITPLDLVIHLGDFDGGEEYIQMISPCPVEMVSGNNDFFNGLPRDKMIQIGKYSIMITHGHRYNVYSGTATLKEVARENHADIVMYGHTHVPLIDLSDSVWVINPGSIALPRQHGRIPTYIILEIDDKGEIHFALNYVK